MKTVARLTVSVALCTHNGAFYLEEQLRSILAQSYPITQLVLSDDDSNDGTVDVVERLWAEYAPEGTRLVVLRNTPALGVTRNFAQAMSHCDGDLIVLSDQDDVWRGDRVEKAVARHVARPEVLVLHSDARLVDGSGEDLGSTLFRALELTSEDLERERTGDAFGLLLRRNLVTGATTSIRRKLLHHTLPIPDEWVHDEWLAIIGAATGRVDWVSDQLIDYRQHGANQIGVTAPTLRYKVGRMLESRGDRNRGLARRARVLAECLDALPVAPAVRDQAWAKAHFETERARLPEARLRRIAPVLRLARTGDYGSYASQGRADIVRDLAQPS